MLSSLLAMMKWRKLFNNPIYSSLENNTVSKYKTISGKSRALVAGWFSYPDRKATFGDIEAKDVVCRWLTEARIQYDVAGDKANRIDGVTISDVDPQKYNIFIFVCGPWAPDQQILSKFHHCFKIGVNLSVENEGSEGFDYLLPRDSPCEHYPDIVFSSNSSFVPVVGIVLVHPQPLYGKRQRHQQVKNIVDELLDKKDIAPIWLDTLLVNNAGCLSITSQFESIIRKTDFVISTRLHGMVFAIKNGVPVIAIDPVYGGAKITAQAKALGWPLVLNGDDLTIKNLENAMSLCLSGAMSREVVKCNQQARKKNLIIKNRIMDLLKKHDI